MDYSLWLNNFSLLSLCCKCIGGEFITFSYIYAHHHHFILFMNPFGPRTLRVTRHPSHLWWRGSVMRERKSLAYSHLCNGSDFCFYLFVESKHRIYRDTKRNLGIYIWSDYPILWTHSSVSLYMGTNPVKNPEYQSRYQVFMKTMRIFTVSFTRSYFCYL
jgi:hypothetical protein